MTRAKRPILSLIVTGLGLAGTAAIIVFVPPMNSWVEIGTLVLLTITLFLGASWLIGNTKRGIQVSLAAVGLLIMHRFGILNLLSFGLWIVVVGLLSLVN